MTDPITIGNAQNKWIKDANTKMMTLTLPASGSGYTSLLVSGSTTSYLIPAGKKFIILAIDTQTDTNYLKRHTVVNASGGTLLFNKSSTTGTFGDLYVEVAAGNYINTFNSNYRMVLTGVETNT